MVAFVVTAALSGCSETSSSPDGVGPSAGVYTGPVPAFSGPWASEFAAAFRSTKSEVVHAILEKGSITDQDYAEVSSAYVRCMANKGFTATITGPAGEGTVDAGEESFEAEAECNADLSVIAMLRGAILRNPDHRDEEEIVAACLVAKKVAPPGYAKRDYEADLQSQKFPYSIDDPGFSACVNDPLGLASGR